MGLKSYLGVGVGLTLGILWMLKLGREPAPGLRCRLELGLESRTVADTEAGLNVRDWVGAEAGPRLELGLGLG